MDSENSTGESPYEAFSRLAEELSCAYRGLSERAETLEQELARSRREKERQREAKEQLADRLRALLDSLPGGVVVQDGDGRATAANAVARDWFGIDPEGRSWAELLAAGGLRAVEDGQELAAADGRRLTVSRRYVTGLEETIVLLTDVTEPRRLQAALEQHRRLATMGEMAARLAHQLRTPLATALLYANHLTEDRLSAAQRQNFGSRLVGRLRDLDRLTRDMLGFVRAGPAREETVSVAALLAAVTQDLAGALEDGAQLEVLEPLPERVVSGDRRALVGALCNLVENAWQAGGPQVRVCLSARVAAGGSVEFQVQDDGPGIEPALAERIFEPFFSERSGGTGLGLPLARSVAEAHGGSLELAGCSGAGARFVLRLPLAGGSVRELFAAGGQAQ